MADIYNSKIAAFVGKLNGSKTGYFAVTISSTCTLVSCDEALYLSKPVWVAEEEIHKQRIAKMGWFNFMTTYLWRLMTEGYVLSDLEVDAKRDALFPPKTGV